MNGSGGALSIKGIANTVMSGNIFGDNNAKVGGAIFYQCGYKDSVTNSSRCKYFVTEKNYFSYNTATERGGAIQWFDPIITDNSNTFTRNYAPYSSDLGSYPKRLYLEFISNNDDLN